jgi:hypothetical protein
MPPEEPAVTSSARPFARTVLTATLAVAGWSAPAFADPTLVDWTSGNAGTLPGVAVSLTSQGPVFHAQAPANATYLNNLYNRAGLFTGPVSLTEGLEVVGTANGNIVTVTFSQPVLGVVMHFASLASTLTFDRPVTRLSGEAGFVVAGNTVSGAVDGSLDRSGSVLIGNVASSFTFDAFFLSAVNDGIGMQMFSGYAVAPVPEPASWALTAAGLLAVAGGVAWRRAARVTSP